MLVVFVALPPRSTSYVLAAEAASADAIAAAHPEHRHSAANLIHYVELRNHDIRELQTALGLLGVSSLGRAEPYVLATVEAVLSALAGLEGLPPVSPTAQIGLDDGLVLLARNADLLLGAAPAQRSTRINCAHDDSAAWKQMIAFVRSGTSADGRQCRIAMDLGGPKLRTGPLSAGPGVVRVRPRRDEFGRVVVPARVWLSTVGVPVLSTDEAGRPAVAVPVDDEAWLRRRRRGDVIALRDSRGSRRRWTVVEVGESGCLATVEQTTYAVTGLELGCRRDDDDDDCAVVGDLPEIARAHRVQHSDRVILTRSLEPTQPTAAGTDHYIGCSLSEAFDHARPGERVWLDDGKIGGTIESVTPTEIALTVTAVRPGGAKLKSGKGINLPDTDLRLGALGTRASRG